MSATGEARLRSRDSPASPVAALPFGWLHAVPGRIESPRRLYRRCFFICAGAMLTLRLHTDFSRCGLRIGLEGAEPGHPQMG